MRTLHRTVNRDFLKGFCCFQVDHGSLKAFYAVNRDVLRKKNLHEYLLLLRWICHLWCLWRQIMNFFETHNTFGWETFSLTFLIVMPVSTQQWLQICPLNASLTLKSTNISIPSLVINRMTGVKAILMTTNQQEWKKWRQKLH